VSGAGRAEGGWGEVTAPQPRFAPER
jgi:hypothetical protein